MQAIKKQVLKRYRIMQAQGYAISLTNTVVFVAMILRQNSIKNCVNQDGKVLAELRYSRLGRGYSEHQFSLAFDLIDKSGNLIASWSKKSSGF